MLECVWKLSKQPKEDARNGYNGQEIAGFFLISGRKSPVIFKEALIKSEISCGAERMVSWKKTRGGARKWDSRV